MKVILIVVVAITVMFNSLDFKSVENKIIDTDLFVGEWKLLEISGEECEEANCTMKFTETTMRITMCYDDGSLGKSQTTDIFIEGNAIYNDTKRESPAY